MLNRVRFIEELLPPVIAATALLVSFADLFGLFSLVPPSRIPMLTLLLMSLSLSSQVIIQRHISEMKEQVQHLVLKIALEHMGGELLEQIDPGLRKVLKDDYFLDVLTFLLTAIKEKKVQVNDIVRLRHYYIRTLESYPKATFLSTHPSTASEHENQRIEKAIASFIRKGGKMKHIIFVRDAQELSLPPLKEKVTYLQQLGVQVHFVNSSTLPGDLRKNFLVESHGKIAWEMHVDHDGHVISGTISANKQTNASYCHIFEKLLESEIHACP
jgi:hypothetical protein